MKKIRIGNDITIKATVTRLGEAEDLTDKQITLTLHSPYESRQLEYEQDGNVLTAAWPGTEQEKTGTYTLTLRLDSGDGSRNTVDCEDFLCLVARTSQAGLTGAQTVGAPLDAGAGSEGVSEDLDLAADVSTCDFAAYERVKRRTGLRHIPHGPVRLGRTGNVYYVKGYCTVRIGNEETELTVEDADGLTDLQGGTYAAGDVVMVNGDAERKRLQRCFRLRVTESKAGEDGVRRATLRIEPFSSLPQGKSSYRHVYFENGVKVCDYTPYTAEVQRRLGNAAALAGSGKKRGMKGLQYWGRRGVNIYKGGKESKCKHWHSRHPQENEHGVTRLLPYGKHIWRFRYKKAGKWCKFLRFHVRYDRESGRFFVRPQ